MKKKGVNGGEQEEREIEEMSRLLKKEWKGEGSAAEGRERGDECESLLFS